MIHRQKERGAEMRKSEVLANRNLLKHFIDVIVHLWKQGLAFRGHNGNFLETLKLLGKYDNKISQYLVRYHLHHEALAQKPKGPKGRGSTLKFLSNNSQNKLINIIGEQSGAFWLSTPFFRQYL